MTRAVALLAKGEVRASLARHPLALPLVAEVWILWCLSPIAIVRAWRPSETLVSRWLLGHVAVFLATWLVRLAWLGR